MLAHQRFRSAGAYRQSDLRDSLIRVFDGCSMRSQESNASSGRKLRLWSDNAEIQTDSNLCCTHTPTCTLCWIQDETNLPHPLPFEHSLYLPSALEVYHSRPADPERQQKQGYYKTKLALKAPRKKYIWKCRLLKSSAANSCLTLLTN